MLFNKLFVTLWKCWRIRLRHYWITLFVIIIPILLYALLGWGRTKLGNIGKHYVNETTYVPALSEDDLYKRYNVDISKTYLLYAPSTTFTAELMRQVQLKMQITNHKFYDFKSEGELVQFYLQNTTGDNVYAVVFDKVGNEVPRTLNYSIRGYEKNINWNTEMRFHLMTTAYLPGAGSELYFHKAFINLQLAIDKSFLAIKTGEALNYELYMQEFPYPPHADDIGFTNMFMILLPLITLFGTVFTFPGTLRRMMEEKESGIKELMKMMGLPPSIMYLAWFVDAFFPALISTVVCTILMKITWGTAYAPVEYSSGVIYGIFLLLYFCSCIAFCLFVASIFDSPSLTTSMSTLVWTVTYMVPSSSDNLPSLGFGINLLLYLVPNVAMHQGFQSLAHYEVRGNGVQWNNLFSNANGDQNAVPFGFALLMLFVDIILLLLLGFYFDQVRPGKFGVAKPWNFPIAGWFNRDAKKTKRKVSVSEDFHDEDIKVEAHGGNAGITIKNMTKSYGEKVAVRDLSVKFYEGEITALLGRNGAGKTTTMSVITGMTSPTRGEVWINNYDICENLNYVRSIMGMCPQHDLLFPELTVFEHVMFFARLRGVHNAHEKAKVLLNKLNIYAKKNLLPSGISGGMKRKLCLAMAMITNPSILILDEPTSGLDPQSRRELWDLILDWRKDHPRSTVLVSTHFMEEADVLGDRITIMQSGTLVAQGTPMYLKKEFANECHLMVILKDEHYREQLDRDCREILREQFLIESNADSFKIITPNHEKMNLIKFIDAVEKKNYVKHAGLSIPSIEDVFLKVSDVNGQVTERDGGVSPVGRQTSIGSGTSLIASSSAVDTLNRYGGLLYQFKRYIPYFVMALALVILICTTGSAEKVSKMVRPGLPLQLEFYGKTQVYYSVDQGLPKDLAETFEKLVAAQGSVVTRVDSVPDALIAMGERDLDDYKQKAVVALEFNRTLTSTVLVNMMYSNGALHGAPIVLNMAMNVLAHVVGNSAIGVTNLPLQTNEDYVIDEAASDVQIIMLWITLLPTALLILVTAYINYPMQERITNFKHLLYMSGESACCYWFRMFWFHYILLYLPAAVLFLIVLILNPLYFPGAGAMAAILIGYGAMMIPFVFLFSYKSSVAAAVGSLSTVTIFTGLVFPLGIFILRNSGDDFYNTLGKILHVIAYISPQYWLTDCLITFTRKAVWVYKWDKMLPEQREVMCQMNYNPCCGGYDTNQCKDYKCFFHDGLAPKNFSVIPVVIILYWIILCIRDSYKVRRVVYSFVPEFNWPWQKTAVLVRKRTTIFRNMLTKPYTQLDSHSENGEGRNYDFKAKNLIKVFNDKTVVNDLSFTVQSGQCYGLLGVNGAGKTTTFNMLTGYEVPTKGTASIKSDVSDANYEMDDWLTTDNYFKNIGYCPQFNALNEVLDARVLLKIFAAHRGITKDQDAKVQEMIDFVGLEEFAHVPCGTLSGGNKRKLCLGISLIGDPRVVFLDEPTTGVDPVSRRKIWECVERVKKGNKPIVLTSHSMDECEKLCDYLAIMKKGQVHMHGNINELKLKNSKGLSIKIKLRPFDEVDSSGVRPRTEKLLSNIKKKLNRDNIELKDEHMNLVHYFVPDLECGLRDLRVCLETMEGLKTDDDLVEDYTISTSTLEDVFLSVARDEEEPQQN